jgi:hypothetical protein
VLTLRTGDRDHIWSDRVTVSLDGWFDAQQSIVRRIAVALNVHLSAERLASWRRSPMQHCRSTTAGCGDRR